MKEFLYHLAMDETRGPAAYAVKLFLLALSSFYRCAVDLRALLYRKGLLKAKQIPRPVISIGNLTMGGVGKTPLAAFIANALKAKGARPAILIRGYMEKGGSALETSDEALMLQKMLKDVPVLVGADRFKSASTFLQHNKADVFILDDGYQRLNLHRDLNIVVIDATNPWGNGFLIPRGILREPHSALNRADVIVLTKTDFSGYALESIKRNLKNINPRALIVDAIHDPAGLMDGRTEQSVRMDSFPDKKICAVSAIGSPDTFTRTLRRLDAKLIKHFSFIDHYSYKTEDINGIVRFCQDNNIPSVITTEKDFVKLKYFLEHFPESLNIYYLKIAIKLTKNDEPFLQRIHSLL